MDRRTFLKYGAGGVAVTMLPLGACSTSASTEVEAVAGPTAIAADGTRYVALPNAHSLSITTSLGERRVGGVGRDAGQLNFPVAIAMIGELAYVVENGNHRVQVFDAQGASVRMFGADTLFHPNAIAADANEIVIADSRNGRLVTFSHDGEMIRSIGAGVLSAPQGIALVEGGFLVADPGLRKVLELDLSGRIRRELSKGWILPKSLASDGESVFVGDISTSELAVLTRAGKRTGTIAVEGIPSFLSRGVDGTLYVS